MKTNRKTILTAVIMLLISSLLLAVSFSALADSDLEDQAFEPAEESFVDLPAQIEAPRTVAEFRELQSVYKHEENGTLTLYSPEQFASVIAERENGGAAEISEEELNFLINDTLQLYRQNTEIVLTNAFTLPCFSYMFDADYLSSLRDYIGTVLRRGDDAVIVPQSLKGIYFRGEGKSAEETKLELQCIIIYRVEMASASLIKGSEKEEFNPGGSNIWRHTLTKNTVYPADYYGPSSYIGYKRICMISFEEEDAGEDADTFFVYSWNMNDPEATQYYSSGTRGAAFYNTETYLTAVNTLHGYKFVDMSDASGKVAEGNRNDLMINGYRFNRDGLDYQTMDLMPGYDIQTHTALLPADEYEFEIGMSYAELINKYGIPYQSYEEGAIGFDMDTMQFTGNHVSIPTYVVPNETDLLKMFRVYSGFYVTADGKLFTVYFSQDGEFTVIGFDCKDLF